jgi:Ca2+-binding EF-hand superfamily protein
MGNSNSADTNFNPLEYVRPGINQHEVIGLRNVFESLDPEDGKIQVNDLKVLYKDSYDKNNIDSLIG